jgi:hypothetical protein
VSLERLQENANGDLVYTFTHPWSDGTTGIRLSPLELLEKLAALVPLPHVHLVRYGGCLAPHSHLRHAIMPSPRQQGMDGEDAHTGTPYWSWARLLGRGFGLEMATCPFCQRGAMRLIAVITQGEVISKSLRHLKRAADPPPIAPVRSRHVTGSPKATMARVGSYAMCAPWRWFHTPTRVHSRPRAPLSIFPDCLPPCRWGQREALGYPCSLAQKGF